METRANFVLIGAFTLAAVVGAFLFIMWIATSGSGSHRHYRIVFNGSVTGLNVGSSVLFNGLKVGEVMELGFVEGNPSQVIADIDVTNASAPINSSTQAQLETTGLTGSGVVALRGGDKKGATELAGSPPLIPSLPTATLADLQTKAGYVLDLANKLLVDNAEPIHRTLENVQNFSQALARNTDGVDAALQGMSDLGKAIQPLATKLQSLAEHTDTLVAAINPDQIKGILRNVEDASNRASAAIGELNKVVAENSGAVRSTIGNVDAFTKTLADNRDNVQAALKGAADFGRSIQPVIQRLQSLSETADKIAKAVDSEKVRAAVNDIQTFSHAVAASSDNYQTLVREGAGLAQRLNETSKTLQTALTDINGILDAVEPQKVANIVDSISGVATTLQDNRPNIDDTLRNAKAISETLNKASVKVDGVLSAAQGFLGSPGTQGAVSQIGDAAVSLKRLADNLNGQVKDIGSGLNRFANSGLRQYEALAVQGQRVLDDIDRVVRSFSANPGQLIWGSRPSLPEYRGQQ